MSKLKERIERFYGHGRQEYSKKERIEPRTKKSEPRFERVREETYKEDVIRVLKNDIEDNINRIREVNPDNVIRIKEKDMEEIGATELAKELLKKYDITLYVSLADMPKEAYDVLHAKTIDEFIDKLSKYVYELEGWADAEEEACEDYIAKEYMTGSTGDIENANYIVKVYHAFPTWGMGQLRWVITCNTEDEARDVARHVWKNWGDYGVPGGNISTEITTGGAERAEEIFNEYLEQFKRLTKYYHKPERLEILSYDEAIKRK